MIVLGIEFHFFSQARTWSLEQEKERLSIEGKFRSGFEALKISGEQLFSEAVEPVLCTDTFSCGNVSSPPSAKGQVVGTCSALAVGQPYVGGVGWHYRKNDSMSLMDRRWYVFLFPLLLFFSLIICFVSGTSVFVPLPSLS